MEIFKPEPPERVVAYFNPGSTHRIAAEEYIDYLISNRILDGLPIIKLPTERDQIAMNESLHANVLEGDVAASFSGDGGTNSILEASRVHPLHPLLVIGAFGNANDIAKMLHVGRYLEQPELAILEGLAAKLYPLSVTAYPPGQDPVNIHAYAYWGCGTTGRMAVQYCHSEVREKLDKIGDKKLIGKFLRLYSEFNIARNELHASQPLTFTDESGSRNLTEINYSNGKIESKVLRFPEELLRHEAVRLEVERPTLPSAVASFALAALHHIVILDSKSTDRFKVNAAADFLTQADGQPKAFPSGTEFQVGLDEQFVYVYTTLRKYIREWQRQQELLTT